ncbi:beta-1,3-glucan-binding protein-like [Euwallacea similis]|uniref:beta-1,3-glucan-binding protein-like n=1 Tax=Euwallacea similis TaxID=1736056 RepID=UPI00344C7C71
MKLIVTNSLVVLILAAHAYADCDVASLTEASGTHYNPPAKLCPGDLIFEEQFDTLDLTIWQHEVTLAGGGNYEFEYYLNNRTNSYVQDGNLHIKPTYLSEDYGENFLYSGVLDLGNECTNNDNNGCYRQGSETNVLNPIESARIRTIESFSFLYGTAIVRAKVPAGDWLWPALWFLPTDFSYGGWPISGEIDLMESRGNKQFTSPDGVNIGVTQMGSTLHWGTSSETNQYPRTHYEQNNAAGYDQDFHIYKVVWNPDGFQFFVDDALIGTVTPPDGGFYEMGQFADSGIPNPWTSGTKMAPFDKRFHMIINLAIGGTSYFPDGFTNPGGKPWSNTSPTAMTDFWKGKSQWESSWNRGTDQSHFIIDYVQIYAI